MSRLILHIGPGKCGSTSIQNLFAQHNASQGGPCVERTFFCHLAPSDFTDLETGEAGSAQADNARIKRLDILLNTAKAGGDVAILSHEFLFQTPRAMGIITERARRIFEDIRIIGYVRPQSALLRSSYSQWLFRAPDRVFELEAVLQSHGLNPDLFTGLERQYIASILDGYHSARQLSGYNLLDLWGGYQAIEKSCNIKPLVGGLPGKDGSLWQDFCEKAGLTLKPDLIEIRANTRFHPHLVDAATEAIRAGHIVMGPHEGNDILTELSQRMGTVVSFNADFLAALAKVIDANFAADNHMMCEHYDIDYVDVFENISLSEAPIQDSVEVEESRRAENPDELINYYCNLSNVLGLR
ncbi:hypothetical protein [Fretibacter rubidus]|uniref:hypothetical protein n=1 Tax=Fretibacter rubidus TaxID=570162 RepID=UPI00352BBE32